MGLTQTGTSPNDTRAGAASLFDRPTVGQNQTCGFLRQGLLVRQTIVEARGVKAAGGPVCLEVVRLFGDIDIPVIASRQKSSSSPSTCVS